MRKSLARVALGGLVTLMIASLSQAQTIIIQTTPGTGATSANLNFANDRAAQAFNTGGNSYSLVDVRIAANFQANVGSGGPAAYDLFSDTAGKPGALLVSLGNATLISAVPTFYTLTPVSNTVLNANTTYWVVARTLGATYAWTGDFNVVPTGSGFVPAATSTAASTDGGGSWNTSPLISGVLTLQVRGNAIAAAAPEPGSAPLFLAAGILAAPFVRRRAVGRCRV